MWFWYSVWVILWINWHMNAKKISCTTIQWICNVNVWGKIPQELAQFRCFWPFSNHKYSKDFWILTNRQHIALRNHAFFWGQNQIFIFRDIEAVKLQVSNIFGKGFYPTLWWINLENILKLILLVHTLWDWLGFCIL